MKPNHVCEVCGDPGNGDVHEYLTDGDIIAHHFCIMHLADGVKKYQHTFKNNKW